MNDLKKTFEQLLAEQAETKPRRQLHSEEHNIQRACIRWFRYQYPNMHHNLFAVPNGGWRDKVTAGKMKAEGVLPGVADLILLKPNARYHALLLEMKTRSGSQSKVQKQWQQLITADGYKYVVCRSLDDFMAEVKAYLSDI